MIDDIREAAFAQNALSGGSRAITYREFELITPLWNIQEAVQMLNEAGMDRNSTMTSVVASLEHGYANVRDGTATNEEAMEYAHDIVLWFANEIVEGRQSLQLQ